MKIVRCDICNNEMTYIFNRDSETQYYTLIKNDAGRELTTDICNECMHKLIDFVNAPDITLTVENPGVLNIDELKADIAKWSSWSKTYEAMRELQEVEE